MRKLGTPAVLGNTVALLCSAEASCESKWELLVYTRQFSYPSAPLGTREWPATAGRQIQDLRDTKRRCDGQVQPGGSLVNHNTPHPLCFL